MQLSKQLANRLQEVLLNGQWIAGTNIKSQVINLDWKQATTKIGSLNTVAHLLFHIDYYIAGVINVLEGGELLIKDKYSFDCPTLNSQKDWKNLIDKFCTDAEKLVMLVENLNENELSETFYDEKYGNYYRNIEGIIEHSYYHFGQISLIKKLLEN